jgi:hypothetical protein
MEGPGYFSEKYLFVLRGNVGKEVAVVEYQRLSIYVVYKNCLGDGLKHLCVCKIEQLGEKIPSESERNSIACEMGRCIKD